VRAAGGALDTVQDGVNGFHAAAADRDAFAVAIRRAAAQPVATEALVAAARRLDTPIFLRGLDAILDRALAAHAAGATRREGPRA